MQTFLVLAGTAGIAAAIVWRATAPPAQRAPRVPAPVEERVDHVPAPPPTPRPKRRPTPPPAGYLARQPEPSDASLVLAEMAVPDKPPSRLFALVRLIFTLALFTLVAVAVAAGVWLVVTSRLGDSLGR